MYRIIFRVILALCLFAAPVVMASCAPYHTEIETQEETLGKSRPKPVLTGDNK